MRREVIGGVEEDGGPGVVLRAKGLLAFREAPGGFDARRIARAGRARPRRVRRRHEGHGEERGEHMATDGAHGTLLTLSSESP
jgi:hypothetical protein